MPDTHTADDRVTSLGITRRQFQYWTEMGYVRPVNPDQRGIKRFTEHELTVLNRMCRLVKSGLMPKKASEIARMDPKVTAIIESVLEDPEYAPSRWVG